jgi:hypothetical protein
MLGHPKPVRVRDDDYRAHIRQMACLLAHEEPCTCGPYLDVVRKRIVTEVAHVRSRGSGGSDPANLWPACHHHHIEQHVVGIKTFEKRHANALGGQTLKHIARQLWDERLAWVERGGTP